MDPRVSMDPSPSQAQPSQAQPSQAQPSQDGLSVQGLLRNLYVAITTGNCVDAVLESQGFAPTMMATVMWAPFTNQPLSPPHPRNSILFDLVALLNMGEYAASPVARYYNFWLDLIIREVDAGTFSRMRGVLDIGLDLRRAIPMDEAGAYQILIGLTHALRKQNLLRLLDILANICLCDLVRVQCDGNRLAVVPDAIPSGYAASASSVLVQIRHVLAQIGVGPLEVWLHPLIVYYQSAIDYIRGPSAQSASSSRVGICVRRPTNVLPQAVPAQAVLPQASQPQASQPQAVPAQASQPQVSQPQAVPAQAVLLQPNKKRGQLPEDPKDTAVPAQTNKKRGRPSNAAKDKDTEGKPPAKKRGRPSKAAKTLRLAALVDAAMVAAGSEEDTETDSA